MAERAFRRTKIVATLGPSSETAELVDALVAAGMDCARLNFSHGTHAEHGERVRLVRAAQERFGRPLAVMADLQGPKLRVARGAAAVTLSVGDTVVLYGDGAPEPEGKSLPVDPPVVAASLVEGQRVLLNDGQIRLAVQEQRGGYASCRVLVGGLAKARQGVCTPGVEMPIPSVTRKDLADLEFALGQGVDYVALSFVRSPEDVWGLKLQIASLGFDIPVIAKIEQAEALNELEDIIAAADAVMVARGDLGVEIGAEAVPLEQKRVIREALAQSKPVITATPMLESMVHQSQPTRAEVSDVANAILDGSSAVMLSGETAQGDYPLEAVETMDRIARHVEREIGYRPTARPLADPEHGAAWTAITSGAVQIAEQLDAAVILIPTASGATARAVARHRPQRPVIGLSHEQRTLQRMALYWGVLPVPLPMQASFEELWESALAAVLERGLVEEGEVVVITSGSATNVSGATNLIKVDVA